MVRRANTTSPLLIAFSLADVQLENANSVHGTTIYSNTNIATPKGATVENDYANHGDVHSSERMYENGNNNNTDTTGSKVALQFDDNSDYAVIDCYNSSGSTHNLSAIQQSATTGESPEARKSSHHYISIANYNRTLLQHSLCEAKQRVAQLKRELDANFNLLSIIDKYYTKGDNSHANAIEV